MIDFLGIGAQKCGTTWLFEMLSKHPQLRFPGGKEIHFWDWNYKRGIDWYLSLFAVEDEGIKKGEITPSYATLPLERITDIYRINPNLRIIYLIRNPIERAWSAALMALWRSEMTIEEASDQWFIDHFCSMGSRMRGNYELCLRNWYQVVTTDQLLVLLYDDLLRNPHALLSRCCCHVGVDEHFFTSLPEEVVRQKVFSGPGHPIRPSLLPVLRDIYHPQICSLAEYLQLDLQCWLM